MPPIYCITLRETPERTARAREELDNLDPEVDGWPADFQWRFVYGIHGKSLDIKPGTPFHTDYYITRGHVGLCLSHLMAWEMMETDDEQEAIICEDDVVFKPGFCQAFSDLRSRFPEHADIVYLEHCCTEGKRTVDVAEGLKTIYYPLCTACYWVNRKALPTLRAALKPINSHIDILLEMRALPNLHHYCAVPPLAGQLTQQGKMSGSCTE